MREPAVSVALATWNGERFLREQLASIAFQSRRPAELVVCDDRSSDATAQILSDFARHAPFPVRVEVNPRRVGYARNFRNAAARCTGDLIAFSDQDDWWGRDKLDRLAGNFEDPEVMLAYHNARIVDQSRRGTTTLYDARLERAKIATEPFAPWHHSYGMTQMFRAELRRFDQFWELSLNEIADPVDIMSHDQWYFFLALVCGKVRFVDENLVDYRQHSANSVGADPAGSRRRCRHLARFEHYGHQDARGAEAARSRAEVLRGIAGAEPGLRNRALGLAERFDVLEERLRRRCETYCGPGVRDRLRSLTASVGQGDYGQSPAI